MPNILSKLLAGMLAALLMLVIPLLDTYQKQEKLSYNVASNAVTTFVDAARNKGYLTPSMYADFFSSLHSAGNYYEVTIEHLSKRYIPVYLDPTDPSTYQNQTQVHYEAFYTDEILKILFPDSTDPIDDPSRVYKLEVGDFITITVKNMNRTNATILKEALFNIQNSETVSIYYTYGGMVHNEDY